MNTTCRILSFVLTMAVGFAPSFGQLSSTGNQFWNQNWPGIIGVAEQSDQFGDKVSVGDFDGDGYDDLAVGVPGESVGSISSAGAVNILYGSSSGLASTGNEIWHQNSPGILGVSESYDRFGSSLATGDFDGDGHDDLAVGVTGESVGGLAAAGAVNILYGSAFGLTATGNQIWHQNSPGILGVAENSDDFGYSLTAGDFDGDGYDDLAIGVPYEDVGSLGDAGAVNIIYGSAFGLTSVGNQIWDQDSPEILGIPEEDDLFGSSLAAGDFDGDGNDDLAVGVPYDSVNNVGTSGAVNVLYGSAGDGLSSAGNQLWNQKSQGILGVAELADRFGWSVAAGDFDGDGVADLAIGVDQEGVGDKANAGAVNVIYGSAGAGLTSTGNQIWHQNSPGILGVSEVNDEFGFSLAVGDFDGDSYDDLTIGSYGESVGSDDAAGAANVLYGSDGAGLTSAGNQIWHQNSPGILDASEDGDRFGCSVAAGDFDGEGHSDLAVGVFYEDLGRISAAGAVNVLYGSGRLQLPKEQHELSEGAPQKHGLLGNYPNPFNPTTTIAYSIEEVGPVKLTVYNTVGQLVQTLVDNPTHPVGEFIAPFNATDLAAGVYFSRLEVSGAMQVKKMMLVK